VHNLPLHLAVELGLPLASALLGLLAWGLWLGARRVHARDDESGLAGRFALALVLLILVHSLLEYPLWYAYFLLPTVWAFGYVLSLAPQPAAAEPAAPVEPVRPWWPGVAAGLLMLAGAGFMLVDYIRVVVIYAPPAHARPLGERIERGQHSPLFGHHADYAAMTTGDVDAAAQALAARRAPHHLLDVRLMEAWAKTLAERGQVDRARYLAARLREFRNPASTGFFAGCTVGDAAQKEFQCQAPQQAHTWREFTSP
jgi:hypothetical protein